MTPINEITDIVADAQKHALASMKDAATLSGRIFQTNLDLTERYLAYQRGAVERFAGSFKPGK
jgi:hypothetical protein